MYTKTGLSFLAAAGVAVGVVGMTMGGASGSPVSCAPSHSGSAGDGSNVSRSSSDRDASNASGVNGASTTMPTTATPVDPAGSDGIPTDPNGNGSGSDNNGGGTTIIVDADTPGGGSGSGSDSGSDSGRNRPLLHVNESTNAANVGGVTVPRTGTNIVGRSNLLKGLHIDVHANQR